MRFRERGLSASVCMSRLKEEPFLSLHGRTQVEPLYTTEATVRIMVVSLVNAHFYAPGDSSVKCSGTTRPGCCSEGYHVFIVFPLYLTSALRGRRERIWDSPEGSNYVFSRVHCNIITLQQDIFLLSVFADFISVDLRRLFFLGALCLTSLVLIPWGSHNFSPLN